MLRNLNLQLKLIGAFTLMGLIVLGVALIGWNGNSRLSQHIKTLSDNSLPSVTGLWKINEGKTEIEGLENRLLDPQITPAKRQNILARIQKSWGQIKDGFKQYESTPRSEEEARRYQIFLQDWEAWKKAHQRFMELEQEYNRTGIRNPWNQQVQFLLKGDSNSPEIARVRAALNLRNLLDQEINQEEPLLQKATDSILAVVEVNENIAEAATKSAEKDVSQATYWIFSGLVVAPVLAISLGVFFSKTITKSIIDAINTVVTAATQIAATVEEQERIANQQATSVNQTTITMDELSASARQASEQAEASTLAARQVAQQVIQLSEQTRQISIITNLVSELASQTNMLALNATVEAVRAGENGKGFAVVAAEIRKLADESKKSATKINSLLTDIQNITDATVTIDNEGRFQSIVSAVNSIVMGSQQISLTSKQQAIAIQQVVTAMNAINAGAQQTATGISQTKIGTQKLNEAAQNLKALGVG